MSPRAATAANCLTSVEQQQLVESCRPLVYRIAGDLRNTGPAYDDLVQEGCVGLCIAAGKFDPARGASFATYATYWVRAFMLSLAINTRGPVRFGSTKNQRRIFFNLGRARRKFEKVGVSPTPEQLARVLNVSVAEIHDALPRMSNRDPSLDIDKPHGGSDGMKLQLVDRRARVDELLEVVRTRAEYQAKLKEAVTSLGPRPAFVIRNRYLREEPLTLREIGEKMGISRERVRQIEEKALQVLRKRLDHPE